MGGTEKQRPAEHDTGELVEDETHYLIVDTELESRLRRIHEAATGSKTGKD